MLAFLSVTLCMKGATVRSHKRVALALAGSLTAAIITAACLATSASGSVQPPLGASPAELAAGSATLSATTVSVATSTVATSTVATSTAAAASAAALPALSGPMVALGDSYTAGALLPADLTASPLGCLRSTKAYPELVAAALGASLTDVACSSAGVKDMTAAQQTNAGTNGPQLNALAADDSLVVLTLGGDDLGFMNVLEKCMELSFTDPWGSPCQAYYTRGGTDQLAAAVQAEAPQMATVLAAIAARAPQARTVVVGYPDLFPLSGGCWPVVPITNGDIAYLRGIELQLNTMLAADAKAAGDTYVDTYTPTIGHDFCQPERVRDIEGLLPGSWAYPFHPNKKGQTAIATAILAALRTA
jgi:lysophospholipase L1-like esterase